MATEFGKRLFQAREHAKLTQQALAALVGMSQSTLAAAESTGAGSRKTPQLAAKCGVNSHWLATGEGEMLDGIVNVTMMPTAPYRVTQPATIETIVTRLGELLQGHSATRQRTIADVFSRFALQPVDQDLATELVAQLQPATPAVAGKHSTRAASK
jgi:DNA-binding XRE family transcriptional regulator